MTPTASLLMVAVSTAALSLAGCSLGHDVSAPAAVPTTPPKQAAVSNGTVHGGQQPVTGSAIYLFAAGASGYGGPSTSLLNPSVAGVSVDTSNNGYVLTDGTGSFAITGDYTCPSPTAQVYAAAVGGNPGLGAGKSNPNLVMIAALGSCSGLTSSTFIFINEVTTVAAAWALAPFTADASDIGTSPGNIAGLVNAFAAAGELSNTATGAVSGPTLPAGAVLPTSKLNTIADILAACVNTTGGVAGDSSACGNLFAAATRTGPAPSNTLTAAVNVARSPVTNAASLFSLLPAAAPFQPTLPSAPTDWTVAVQYTSGGFTNPKSVAIDAQGNAWIANCGSVNCTTGSTGSIVELSTLGAPVASPFAPADINIPVSIALDLNGNVWYANRGGNSVGELNSAGTPVAAAYTGGGLSSPSAISVDGTGNIWVANAGNSSVTELSNSGTAVSPSGGYTSASANAPVSIAITPH